MAQTTDSFNSVPPRQRTDGALACIRCGTSALVEDPGWCPAVGALSCDACCRSLASGEPRALAGLIGSVGRRMRALEVMTSCASCPRMLERISEAVEDEELFA